MILSQFLDDCGTKKRYDLIRKQKMRRMSAGSGLCPNSGVGSLTDPRHSASLQCGSDAIRFDRKRPVPATLNVVTSHP